MSREAMKLALDYIVATNKSSEFWLVPDSNLNKTVTALREALAEQQEPVFAIRLLTNQCFALAQERDELQKQVWRYEKNGVTCQTYRHKVDASCSECNVHEVYTSPPAQQKPVAWVREHELPLAPGDAFSWVETFVHKTPLYTSPTAQRTWVGLTLEDMETTHWSPDFRAGAKWAAAKLKEKNNG